MYSQKNLQQILLAWLCIQYKYNKIHINVGQEDLVSTKAMLARITKKPGQRGLIDYNLCFINTLCFDALLVLCVIEAWKKIWNQL